MVFNVGKCKLMHMGQQNPAFNYTMKGQVLEETKEEKDIGVMVTSNLKPTAQCARAAKTAQTVLGQISRTFHYRTGIYFFVSTNSMCGHIWNFPPRLGLPGRRETGTASRRCSKELSRWFRAQKQYL